MDRRPRTDRDRDSTLYGLFRAQAERTPEATALIAGSQRWTYRQLRRRAEAIGSRLRALDLPAESRVAICLPRRPPAVAAILGALEAGAAYVPLDPGYPAERRAFMLSDSAAEVLVAAEGDEEWGPESAPHVLRLDAGGRPHGGGTESLAATVLPDQLAYVIYTSGSTGRPKGVAIEHRSAVAMLDWAAETFAPDEVAGLFAATSFCFDLSVFELFAALTRGGAVILAKDALELPTLAAAGEVTLLNTVPSAMTELLRAGGLPPGVRTVNLAGEPLRRDLVERVYATGTVRRVFNLYGPSEDTTYSTAALVPPGADRPVTIGLPIPGTRAVVVDPALRPVSEGIDGELLLGGTGQARGYLGRPARTAASFIPDPFSAQPGARLYRTGDRVRPLASGELDFRGRLDHQVKLRGFRIELGEIETALAALEAVEEAVAVVREDVPGDRRLVAYWVASPAADAGSAPGDTPPSEALRAGLAQRLPGYMIPGRFVQLVAFPLTPNGKLDRGALPAPEGVRPDVSAAYRPPGGATEELLAEIWRELLGIDRVGVDDPLIELGGHSLIAAQIAARVRRSLGVDLPPVELFRHPTVAALAAHLDALQGGSSQATTLATPPPATLADRAGRLPLTFPQEQVWVVNQLAPGNLAYNFQYSLRLRGPLDHGALERTLTEIVRRHESLRTTFPQVDGEARQEIHPPWAVRVPQADLTALPPARREEAARRAIHRGVRVLFDVLQLPLLSWTLFRLTDQDHVLLQVEQHFVHDGWSISVIVREIVTLYPEIAAGRPSPLPELPVQYADYAAWQRDWMQGDVLEHQLAYWREELAGAPVALDLPSDRPRPRVQSHRGGRLDVELPPALYDAVRAFGRRQGMTLFMTLLAAFEALIYRYTGREDFLLGTAVANRRLREFEGLIGMIVNTLVLRGRLGGGPDFRQLLERARDSTVGMQSHQDLPFERLVEELQPERDLSRNPLYQVMFSFHDAPVPDLDLGDVAGELKMEHNGSAKCDVNVIVLPRAEQRVGRAASSEDAVLRVLWEYSTDLFDRTTVERSWRHFQVLLAAAIEDPDQAIGRLPLLTAGERQQLLVGWNDTASEFPRERTIQDLFEKVAAERPDAVAVARGGQQLSYGELDRRSAALARRLASQGVGIETRVGLAVERSLELVIGALAILRAGGCYVPLDPDYPRQRSTFMMEDAAIEVLLATESAAAALPPARHTVSLSDGDDSEAASRAPASLPEVPATALAYVLYTSGSTGRPKGVAVPHRAVLRLTSHADYADLGPEQVFLALAPMGFDLSTFELWAPLTNGGRLEVMPPGPATLAEIGRTLETTRVSTLWLTAGLFHQMVESELPSLAAVRQLLAGGDALSPPHVRRVLAELPATRMIDGYGPTENTTFTSAHTVEQLHPRETTVPIGRPIAATRVQVLDDRLEPVPAGVWGELCTGGAGLARGYLGRPGRTAATFVLDPFPRQPGDRLYRTGDLARWRADGVLEFGGRRDGQVKIRGFRIELGEIDAALAAHPAIARAAVVARSEEAGGRLLAAYLVPADAEAPPSVDSLRDHLRQSLPDHMVPSHFTFAPELPLNPHGKVDRRALAGPQWTPQAAAEDTSGAEARNPVEELLAGIWSEILAHPAVRRHDDFFALGGHSLRGTRMLSRVRDAFAVELPLTALFEQPTVAGLAASIGQALSGELETETRPPLTAIAAGERGGDLPVSFGQERLWFVDRLLHEPGVYTIARAWNCAGPLDVAALRTAAQRLAERHEVLTVVFAERTGRPVQRPVTPRLPVPLVDLSALEPALAAAKADRVSRREARRPFELARDRLTRMALLRFGEQTHRLLLTQHHIVSDAWSLGVLARDLSELYEAAAGRQQPPAAPVVQYADYAAWQRQWLGAAAHGPLLDYWRQQLAGAPGTLDLPTDRPRPALQTFRGAQIRRSLSATDSERLSATARAAGATPFIALFAAAAAVLGRFAGQDDVVLGSPVAGRDRRETEDLIGFFVNTLPLRLRIDPNRGFEALLQDARGTVLGAFSHQALPFERLVEELHPRRDLSRPPIFQATVAMQNVDPGELELGGAQVTPQALPDRPAHYDLGLFVHDLPGAEHTEEAGGLELLWSYNRDLFDATTVERLASHLERWLRQAQADLERPVAELSGLSPAEEKQLLTSWSRPSAAFEQEQPVHLQVAQRAAEMPAALAVAAGDRQITYGELMGRARWLAAELRAAGAGADSRVAVFCEPGPELVTACLGTLLAGAAYLPLDPHYPPARLAFMLADAEVRVGIADTPPRLPAQIDGGVAAAVRWIGFPDGAAADSAQGQPLHRASPAPEQLAYAIYTSGSTGRPKAVGLCHRGLANLVAWHRNEYGVTAADRTTLVASPAFDASVWEMWPSLTAGASLHVPPEELRADPQRLYSWLATETIDLTFLPTPLGEAILRLPVPSPLPLRTLLVGGDRLSERPPDDLPFDLVNHYGPTEATVVATAGAVEPASTAGGALPSIGTPIAGIRLLILDDLGRPTPVGVPGQIHLAGGALARGYLGRPGLTAAAFVPDPTAGAAAGERLYRTGDLARWRSDGSIDFLGRTDHQVKVRGFRIELGEIESALLDQPGVESAVVTPTADSEQLVAFVVSSPGETPSAATLRSALAESLPIYMVPAAVETLDRWPLNAAGKIDRRALRERADLGAVAPAPQTRVAPRTLVEQQLVGLWSEVLGVEPGVEDDFFALGGHSLRATELLSKVRQQLGVAVSVSRLFMEPTVAGLAVAIERARAAGAHGTEPEAAAATSIPRVSRRGRRRSPGSDPGGSGR